MSNLGLASSRSRFLSKNRHRGGIIQATAAFACPPLVLRNVGHANLNEKVRTISTMVLLMWVFSGAMVSAKEVPTEAQVQELFDAVQREVPAKVRVLSLYEKEKAAPSNADIKRRLDHLRTYFEKEAAGLPEPARAQRIEQNLQLNRLAMTGKEYYKIQEWKSGPLYRLDKAYSLHSLQEADSKTNWDTTYVNLVNETNGAISAITVNHDTESFETRAGKGSLWTEIGAWKAMTVEPQVVFMIGFTLGTRDSILNKAKDESQILTIDQTKLKRILAGHDPTCKLSLNEKMVGGEALDDFEMDVEAHGKTAMVLVECLETNFRRIVRTEMRGSNGELILSSTRGEFDSQDFPHEYALISREQGGYVTNRYLIKKVELNAQFSDDEVFRFAPPKNYGVVDMSSGKPVIKTYPGGVKPQGIVDVSSPLKRSAWYANPVVVRTIILTVFLLPPLAAIFLTFKKRLSKRK